MPTPMRPSPMNPTSMLSLRRVRAVTGPFRLLRLCGHLPEDGLASRLIEGRGSGSPHPVHLEPLAEREAFQMPPDDVLELREGIRVAGHEPHGQGFGVRRVKLADARPELDAAMLLVERHRQLVLEVLAELPEVAPGHGSRHARFGRQPRGDRVHQIRSTLVAAASSAAAISFACSPLSGPRDRRSRSASLRFSIARTICDAGPSPPALPASSMRARRASSAGRFASRKTLPCSVI